jgi:gamma-glutamylcyclotransferase (GGCT)/AIG2-like uncharacterized protein YtfP
MSDRLFVYGTLRPGHAPKEISKVVETFTPIGRGTVRAKLYDFGDYPGIVLDEKTGESVYGEVFALPSGRKTLDQLDAYEEYSPQDPKRSLFKRLETTVTLMNGARERCWVYVYNQALPKSA